jgi:Ca-activated chloride channel family protein
MRSVALLTCCLSLASWIVLGQQAQIEAGREFKISATVDLVLLDVSVRDKQGGFVSGLNKSDFKVFENGKQQALNQFSNADQPVTVGLIVDNSGSMGPKRTEVVTAALVFVGASNPLDEMFVLHFNDKVEHGLPDTVLFSDDIQQLRAALWRGPAAGRTALYDAVLAGLHQLEMGRQAKKTLIVISDGGDNISKHTFKDVMDAVLASQATIYTVGIFDEGDPDRNPAVLKKLAQVSGGVAYFPDKLDEVLDICRQIAKDVRSRYTLAYSPQDINRPGAKHIKVDAVSADRGKLVARTRSSYVVPTVQAADRNNK